MIPNQKTVTTLCAAGTALILATSAKANLIADGDFSTPVLGTTSTSYSYGPTGTPWTFSPLINGVTGSGITYIPSDFQNSPLFTQVGFLQNASGTIPTGDGASISQKFSAPSAGTYALSFTDAGRSFGGNTIFTVSVNGNVVDTLTTTSGQPTTPQLLNVSLLAGLNNNLAFTVTSASGNDETAFIDNVSITAVPEATTVIAGALLLLPFGMGAIRSLRKHTSAA